MRVLFRGGLRAAEEADVAGVVDTDAAGEGVDVSDISGFMSSDCMVAVMARCGLLPSQLGKQVNALLR